MGDGEVWAEQRRQQFEQMVGRVAVVERHQLQRLGRTLRRNEGVGGIGRDPADRHSLEEASFLRPAGVGGKREAVARVDRPQLAHDADGGVEFEAHATQFGAVGQGAHDRTVRQHPVADSVAHEWQHRVEHERRAARGDDDVHAGGCRCPQCGDGAVGHGAVGT